MSIDAKILPNELRIGNKVKNKDAISTVCGIQTPTYSGNKNDGRYVLELDIPESMFITIDELEPIVITENILTDSFGFSLSDSYVFYLKYNEEGFLWIKQRKIKGRWMWICFCGNVIFNLINIANIKYVHQLQNLIFCLTGKELSIEL